MPEELNELLIVEQIPDDRADERLDALLTRSAHFVKANPAFSPAEALMASERLERLAAIATVSLLLVGVHSGAGPLPGCKGIDHPGVRVHFKKSIIEYTVAGGPEK